MGKQYTDLDVWTSSRSLANKIYEITKGFPKEEIFGLTSQLRRAAVSIPSNIAEGCGRQYSKDAIQFFFVARGPLYELETQLYIASDQGYISPDEIAKCLEEVAKSKQLINGFISYYKSLNNRTINKE
ncbi:MAG: four helix bundle protein [Adhaeribacter sp.]